MFFFDDFYLVFILFLVAFRGFLIADSLGLFRLSYDISDGFSLVSLVLGHICIPVDCYHLELFFHISFLFERLLLDLDRWLYFLF